MPFYDEAVTLYRDTGVVLRTYKLGESDRIVVILTAEHGKVRAVAKGVRKTKSRFGGRLEPLSHLSLLMYEHRQQGVTGRELDIVSQADTIDSPGALLGDLDRLTPATAEVGHLATAALEHHLERRLKSVAVFENG